MNGVFTPFATMLRDFRSPTAEIISSWGAARYWRFTLKDLIPGISINLRTTANEVQVWRENARAIENKLDV